MKRFLLVLGAALLVTGIWGIATGGHDHALVVFGVNANHNLVHLVSGALAVVAALLGPGAGIAFCFAFGTVYGLVAVLGLAGIDSLVRALNLNLADHVLHAVIAGACLVAGVRARRTHPSNLNIVSHHSSPGGIR